MFLRQNNLIRAFTLIEMSIVLVIIGLVVGGVLVGQNLISAAAVRAQIAQIEKYNQAVNTFRSKFNAIPGDMGPATASQFGFVVGTGCAGGVGQRDSDGLILDGGGIPYAQGVGETALFWQDLSSGVAGNLIDGVFPNGGVAPFGCTGCPVAAATAMGEYLPAAKIAASNYVYVYEYSGSNWFGVGGPMSITTCANMGVGTTIPVGQAYAIDNKIDDGIPLTGNVQAINIYNQTSVGPSEDIYSNTNPASCMDGNPTIFPNGAYSVSAAAGNNANTGNCALSFKFN